MSKNEFIDKMTHLADIVEKWRYNNDDVFYSQNRSKIFKLFTEIILNVNKINLVENEIQNVESLIKICFLDSLGITNFQKIQISGIEIDLITNVFNDAEKTGEMLLFSSKNDHFLIEPSSISKIYFVIFTSLEAFNIFISEEISHDQKIKKYIDIFSDRILKINNNPNNLERGRLLIILMYVFAKYLTIKEMIKMMSQECLLCIKDFHIICKNKNNEWTVFNRLLEFHFLNKIKKRTINENDIKLCHYTDMESLYNILKNNSLRFSELKSLNDMDENNLLSYKTKNRVFILSFSLKNDSLDLFGNYTNMEGISIEFNSTAIFQSINNLIFMNDRDIFVSLFDFGKVNYSNNPQQQYFDKEIEKLSKYLKLIVPEEDINDCINGALQYINYYWKKEPWKYEHEFRIAMNIRHEFFAYKVENAIFNEKSIDLKINPKRLIKSITIGPNIKKSEYKRGILKKMLKEFGMSENIIIDTEANYIS